LATCIFIGIEVDTPPGISDFEDIVGVKFILLFADGRPPWTGSSVLAQLEGNLSLFALDDVLGVSRIEATLSSLLDREWRYPSATSCS